MNAFCATPDAALKLRRKENEGSGLSRPWIGPALFSIALVSLIGTRLAFIFRYRFDSDESQHLHVVWGWTRGLVQYKDVFDNHAPLFHILCAPLLKWVGERPDALILMRLAMAPLFFWCLWSVFQLGRHLHSATLGRWAALLVAVTPGFCLTITEFRNDDLWSALWLAFLVVLFGGRPTVRRGFVAGLLAGACLATSLKALALGACLCVGCIVALACHRRFRKAFPDKAAISFLAAILAGCVILPAIVTIYLRSRGALSDAAYGIFAYNNVSGLGRIRILRDFVIGMLEFLCAVSVLTYLSGWLGKRYLKPEKRLAFSSLFLGSGYYGALIYTLWPLLDAEHLIPFWPVFVLCLTPLLLEASANLARLLNTRGEFAAISFLFCVSLAMELRLIQRNRVSESVTAYAELLKISNPSDCVMDLKGEFIFRRRPSRHIFEGIGINLAQRRLMADDIPQTMIQTGTCIVTRDNWRYVFPKARQFMNDNYLRVAGRMRVLGHSMTPMPEANRFEFNVVIPNRFALVSGRKLIAGELDGLPCQGVADLEVGRHTFHSSTSVDRMSFVWNQAIQRGFSPRE